MAPLTMPFIFTPHTDIAASEVNQNFEVLRARGENIPGEDLDDVPGAKVTGTVPAAHLGVQFGIAICLYGSPSILGVTIAHPFGIDNLVPLVNVYNNPYTGNIDTGVYAYVDTVTTSGIHVRVLPLPGSGIVFGVSDTAVVSYMIAPANVAAS